MSFDGLLIHTVTIFNVVSDDQLMNRYGDEELEWDDGTQVRARVQPVDLGGDEEHIINRDTRVTMYRVFLPPQTAITALSFVEYDSRRFRVKGRPSVIDGMSGPHHVEAMLEEVEG